MATQIKAKRPQEEEKILYLSREEAVTLIKNLITLLTDPIGGGVTNMMVYPEDPKVIPYRLYLIPRRPEKEKGMPNNKLIRRAVNGYSIRQHSNGTYQVFRGRFRSTSTPVHTCRDLGRAEAWRSKQ